MAGSVPCGGPGLTRKQMKARASSGPEGQAHSPMDTPASGWDLQPAVLSLMVRSPQPHHPQAERAPPSPSTRPWRHSAPQANRPRGCWQSGLSLVRGFQDGVLSLPLETGKLGFSWGQRGLWEGRGPSRHLPVLLTAMVATQHAVLSERHSPAHRQTRFSSSSKQRLVLGFHGPPDLPAHRGGSSGEPHPQTWLPTSPLPDPHSGGQRCPPLGGGRNRAEAARGEPDGAHACPPLPSRLCLGAGTALWPGCQASGRT